MLVLLMSLGLSFNSCSDNDDDPVEIKAELTVTPETLQFSALGGNDKIIVSTKLNSWTFTADPAETWCTATKANDTLKIEVGEFSEKTDRTAKIKVTSGNENKEITVIQKGVSTELSPETKEVTLNGFGTAIQIKITATDENWEAVADENSPWLRPSKEGEYLVIRATLTESDRNGTILLSLNDAKTTVTVNQTGASFNVGDLYLGEDGTAVGVIINKDEANNNIYIISTEERQIPFTNGTDQKVYTRTDSKDGKKALEMLKAEENYKEKYTIATYCEEIEEKTKINGWYIAAGYEDEVWNALNDNKDVINNALKSSGNQELESSMEKYQEFWTSTPLFSASNTYATSITMRKLDSSKYAWRIPSYRYIARCVLRIQYINE